MYYYPNASKASVSNANLLTKMLILFVVYDLLVSADCLPDLLQGGIQAKNMDNVFILASLQLQNKAPTRVFRIFNALDNTDYLDFTVQGKFNKGLCDQSSLMYFTFSGSIDTWYVL